MDLITNATNTTLVSYSEPTFSVVDYVIFGLFLSISGSVGVFFSIRGHKDTGDYFFGGRQMGAIPIGISNGVSFLSALSLVGLPAEIYNNGSDILTDPLMGCISFIIGGCVIAHVLYPLGMSSLTEYFSKRYKSKVLTYIANIIVLLCIFEYMGSCMIGSVVAFKSATGGQVSVILGLTIAGVVGIFYTSIGGLQAVVWSDVIQCGFMLTGISVVVIKSILDTPGGMPTIVEFNKQYQRIHPMNWSPDITIRHTGWGMFFGKFMYMILWPIQPAGVQRLCSTRTQRDSYIVAIVAGCLYILFGYLPLWAGLNIFGYYAQKGCDPLSAGWIEKNDVILYFVREQLSFPGFQGLLIAALFSGSLSSFSSGLSAASAILWKDTITPLLPFEVSELRATFISKILVVIFGILSMVWSYTIYSFGGLILQVVTSIDSSMYGAYFGLFLLSMFCRNSNYKGAIAGLVISFSITLWLGLGSVMYGKPMIGDLPRPLTNCANITNATTFADSTKWQGSVFLQSIYSISYIWLPTICVSTSLLVALVVTACTKSVRPEDVNLAYIFPLCRGGFCQFQDQNESDNVSLPSEDDFPIKEHELHKMLPMTERYEENRNC